MMKKKILISQPVPQSGKSPYYDIAEKYGYEVVFRPFFKVVSVSTREFRNQKIDVSAYTSIVFTSRTAIDHFFQLAKELRLVIPEDKKYFCINESVAAYLQKYISYRKRKVFYGTTGQIDDLAMVIKKHNKESYFLPVAEEHKNDLSDLLTKYKINYVKGIMYRTVSNDFLEGESIDDYSIVLFFSPNGVATVKNNFPDFNQDKVILGAFGPATCKAVTELGYELSIAAPVDGLTSMTAALEDYLSKQA